MNGRPLMRLMAVAGLIWLVASCSSSDDVQQADSSVDDGGRRQVIFDYSPTLSDVTTLMYLTQHPDVDLLAVTLAGTGESHCEERRRQHGCLAGSGWPTGRAGGLWPHHSDRTR